MQTNGKSNAFRLSVMTLAVMNITAVVSLRGLATEAVYGPASAFYYLFAAMVFLIPTAMIAAELAAMFSTKQGGVFRWVGEAFGARAGFLAIWLQWIQSTIWYPTVLTFGAVSIAFIGSNTVADEALASNRLFTLVVVLAIYWIATLISLKGLSWVGKISKWGGIIGTIIPAALLILLAIVYLLKGGHNNLNMHQSFFPDLTHLDNIVLASSIFLFYAGMEMMGIHVMEVDNPKRNYPRAIIIGSLATVLIFILLRYRRACKGYKPHADAPHRLRPLLQLPRRTMAWLRRGHSPRLRRLGMCAHLGVGPLEGYLRRGARRIPPAILPEAEQRGRAAQHTPCAGHHRHAPRPALRSHALGAVVLPDTLAAHRAPIFNNVYAHVCRSHHATL